MFPQPGRIFKGAHWASWHLNLTKGVALAGNNKSKGLHQTPDHWELVGRGNTVKTDFCRSGEEASAIVQGQARAHRGTQHECCTDGPIKMQEWRAAGWPFSGPSQFSHTYTAHDSQTSDYHANKYEEDPELNSILVQQSHLSLRLILCWIARGSWNKT